MVVCVQRGCDNRASGHRRTGGSGRAAKRRHTGGGTGVGTAESKEITIVKIAWTGVPRFWALNVTKAPTDDLKVRQAINYAVNKDAIINTIYKGIGTKGFAPMTALRHLRTLLLALGG